MKRWNRLKSFVARNLTWATWKGRFQRMCLYEIWIAPWQAKIQGKQLVYFLWVNKTAGTSLFASIANLSSPSFLVVPLPHKYGMPDLPKSCKVALFIRNPERRFASGFEHSYKKGYPHYKSSWSKQEYSIFSAMSSFDQLVEATNSELKSEREFAEFAWKHIAHLQFPYRHYFGDAAYAQANLHRVVFVGEQETFEADCDWFFEQYYGVNVQMEKLNVLKTQRELNSSYRLAIESIYPDEYALYELMRHRKQMLIKDCN